LESAKRALRPMLAVVPLGGVMAVPFSTKMSWMGTWSRRLRTRVESATFDAALFTKRRFLVSR
jgi:hypothetical protein